MANSTTKTHPFRIDTFGADVTISSDSVRIKEIIVTAYSSDKTVKFIDSDGAEVLVFEVPSGRTGQITPAKPIPFSNGFIFDDSESDLAAGDYIFIWVA